MTSCAIDPIDSTVGPTTECLLWLIRIKALTIQVYVFLEPVVLHAICSTQDQRLLFQKSGLLCDVESFRDSGVGEWETHICESILDDTIQALKLANYTENNVQSWYFAPRCMILSGRTGES